MKKALIYTLALMILGQNAAHANRVDSVVNKGVTSVSQDIKDLDNSLAAAEEHLLNIEKHIIAIQKDGEIARYTTIGLVTSSAIVATVGFLATKGAPDKGGTVFILASVPAALSGISHLLYGLQSKEIDKEQTLLEIENAKKQLGSAETIQDPKLKASILELQISLQDLAKAVQESKRSEMNEFGRETTTMLNAVTGFGLVIAGTSNMMGSSFGRMMGLGLGFVAADLSAIPALISTMTDTNKAEVLAEVQKTRLAISQARVLLR